MFSYSRTHQGPTVQKDHSNTPHYDTHTRCDTTVNHSELMEGIQLANKVKLVELWLQLQLEAKHV